MSQSAAAVKSFSIDTSGTAFLSAVNSVSLPTGCAPKVMAPLMDDSYLIAACSDGSGQTISLKIESDGSLTQMDTSTRNGMKVNSIVSVTF